MATVLIIATDQIIGGLLGQLTELAGHSAQFRRAGEEAGQAVRAGRPDVVLLDAAYGHAMLDAVSTAAAEVGAPVVYFATTLSLAELRRFAQDRDAPYFALPAGPRLLRQVLSSVLGDAGTGNGNGHPGGEHAVAAASAAVARARVLADQSTALRTESRTLRTEHEATLADCRRSYAQLREAVISYTRELRGAGVPPDRTLEMVRAAVQSNGGGPRANAGVAQALDDAVEWCLQAYYAA